MTGKDLTRGVYGAWELACFNRHGIQLFENTLDGFWRSFRAALLCAPLYTFLILTRSLEIKTNAGGITSSVIYSISYVISWFAFPYAIYHVSRILDRQSHYFRYISAYNWGTVIQLSALLLVSLITYSQLLPQTITLGLTLTVIFGIFIYKGFIAHVGLEISRGPAFALVILDFILALIFESWTLRLLQAQPINSTG
ncbi:MAG: hypothetical protein VW226_05500 [Rhodospirillaceae bacterium]